MKLFAELYFALDTTSNPEVRVRALVHYFRQAPPEDAIWALRLLLGKRPRRVLPLEELQQLARQTVPLPDWLIEESLKAVKDTLEAVTLLLPSAESPEELPLHKWLGELLPGLRDEELQSRNAKICSSWKQMDFQERFVWNKILSGGFRLQLPDSLLVKALSAVSGLEIYVLAYRIKQLKETNPTAYHALIAPEVDNAAASRPYPFTPRQVLDRTIESPGRIQEWHIEWYWEGLRVQCVKRQGQFFLWSQKTELLTDKFPELHEVGQGLPDGTVVEAQIAGWQNDSALPLEMLQTRIRRKHLSKKLLQETPIRIFALDVLEYEGQDIRKHPYSERMDKLAALLPESPVSPIFHISPKVQAGCWSELDALAEQARKKGAAGLMLTPLETNEEDESNVKAWWSWKARPFTLLGVLMYVQRRQGQSMTSVNEYSVGVRDGDRLVKVATAEGTFPQEEQEEIDRFVKENTLERFGPVRSIKAELVFELSFEGIRKSARHKAGIKLDNPQISRWRREKGKEDADSLARLQGLLCETGKILSIPAQ